MAQLIADRRDIDFVLYEQLEVEPFLNGSHFNGQTRKMFDMILTEARNFAIKEILPLSAQWDREGLVFENNQVRVPTGVHRVYRLYMEGEYLAMTEDPDVCGMGLPHVIALAAREYLCGADISFALYGIGTHGAAKMIEVFGTAKQKALFLKKMYSGQWGGTMVLTESEAGSDLSLMTTSAKRNDDGTYFITGNKIFITNGEHDLTGNIIHAVLARIEGAPAGTRGISLFLVPKIWVNDDGSLGETNDVVCTGIEEKMGLHASPTCQMAFGSKGQCRGHLLGEENRGMQVMFHMMNEARLIAGAGGKLAATNAYLYALDYAKTRVQGVDLDDFGKKDAAPVPIIQHPDVKRMLLWMKSHVEGMRSLIYYTAMLFDRKSCSTDPSETERLSGLIEFLTPVIKAYCTDRGFDCTVQAMQVFGGSGYIKDYPIEQLLRDSKIHTIYEGTNGIQAIDFLGRKLGMNNGAVYMAFDAEIRKATRDAKDVEELKEFAEILESTMDQLAKTAGELGKMTTTQLKTAFSFATSFQDAVGDVTMAWMLLWRATIAAKRLQKLRKGKKQAVFYEGQIRSAEFFCSSVLPLISAKLSVIRKGNDAVVKIPVAAYG